MAIAQIPLTDLLGENVVFDETNQSVNISLADLATVGLDTPSEAKALEIVAAIVKKVATRLIVAPSEQVLAQAELSVLAPFSRDGIDRTLFTYSLGFFRDYANPEFDPNEPAV